MDLVLYVLAVVGKLLIYGAMGWFFSENIPKKYILASKNAWILGWPVLLVVWGIALVYNVVEYLFKCTWRFLSGE